jgi:hypothetical protein
MRPRSLAAVSGRFLEGLAGRLQGGLLLGVFLPAQDADIDVDRIEFHGESRPLGQFGGNDRRTGPYKWIVDKIARLAVVLDWSLHASNRLLRTMARFRFHRLADLPKRRLRAITLPMSRRPFSNGIPTRLVLKMIVAAPDGELLLGPNDLGSDFEAGALKRFEMLYLKGTRRVPFIDDIAGE